MANKTQHYNLNKPLETEAYNIGVFNENADLIDSALKALADLVTAGVLTKERVLSAINQAIEDGDTVNANRLNGKTSSEFATSTQGARADALVEGTTPAGNASKLGGELPSHYAKKSSTYTKAEVDNAISQVVTDLDWKESVATYADLATTYPSPQDGWTVNVKDTDVTYRWSGSKWIAISANAIPKATTSVDGLMTKAQVAQLNAALPSSAQAADSAKLGGKLPSEYLGKSDKAADSDKLDGKDSSEFAASTHNHDTAYLAKTAKAVDSDKLDGKDGSEFATASHTHTKDDVKLGNVENNKTATKAEILAGNVHYYVTADYLEQARKEADFKVGDTLRLGGTDASKYAQYTAPTTLPWLNLNDCDVAGFYSWSDQAITNYPVGAVRTYCYMLVLARGSGQVTQVYFSRDGGLFSRQLASSAWTPWQYMGGALYGTGAPPTTLAPGQIYVQY